MKIAISSSTGDGLSSITDPRFGRAPYFVFIEDEAGKVTRKVYALKNSAADVPAGAGAEAAQLVMHEGIEAVVSGAVGPNAYKIFEKVGVDVFLIQGNVTVEEAYEKFKEGALQKMRIKRL